MQERSNRKIPSRTGCFYCFSVWCKTNRLASRKKCPSFYRDSFRNQRKKKNQRMTQFSDERTFVVFARFALLTCWQHFSNYLPGWQHFSKLFDSSQLFAFVLMRSIGVRRLESGPCLFLSRNFILFFSLCGELVPASPALLFVLAVFPFAWLAPFFQLFALWSTFFQRFALLVTFFRVSLSLFRLLPYFSTFSIICLVCNFVPIICLVGNVFQLFARLYDGGGAQKNKERAKRKEKKKEKNLWQRFPIICLACWQRPSIMCPMGNVFQ